jgi:hypothetical protein
MLHVHIKSDLEIREALPFSFELLSNSSPAGFLDSVDPWRSNQTVLLPSIACNVTEASIRCGARVLYFVHEYGAKKNPAHKYIESLVAFLFWRMWRQL